jgi:hypothetical protein
MHTVPGRTLAIPLTAVSLAVAALLASSCKPDEATDTRPAGSDGWLTGDAHQKFDTLANQLGGFDQTMIEVGYRYIELYWAGQDENWEYARYQIDEMRSAMESGFVRRPARETSAQGFMNNALPAIEEAVARGDAELFQERFRNLTLNCNACHVMEDVRFIVVEEPTVRANAWRGPNR